ncbi:helix-turn-helix domain-containing protein [Lentzea sp. NPDC042327]|uniref:helix-turn-helix domain-containing protein n=1 Tax=Lentzea sp. NPDC042327 TaxID=3154801 RepID=UPI0033D6B688
MPPGCVKGDQHAVTSSNVPALRRGLAILIALARRPEPVSAMCLATATGLPRSTTYHSLNELLGAGFVMPCTENRYGLGPAALEVGVQHLRHTGHSVQVLVTSGSDGAYDVLCATAEKNHLARKDAADLLTAELGRHWRAKTNPAGATVLDLVRAWRHEPRNKWLCDVLGHIPNDAEAELVDGHAYALGQLLGYLRTGELRLVRAELAGSATGRRPSPYALRGVRPRDCKVHVAADKTAFVRFEPGSNRYTTQRLWSVEPEQPRALTTPSMIPLACGPISPMTTLEHIWTQTAVARWVEGSAELVVPVTHPPGAILQQQHATQLIELLQPASGVL